jgi:hypothetical protein
VSARFSRNPPTPRSLVIARVGRGSLHENWIASSAPRDWDLVLCPFEPLEPGVTEGCTVTEVIPGPKWTGLRTLLNEWPDWRSYDSIWLPDDDIVTDAATISRMFEVAHGVGLDLFAPALHEASHFAHFTTMRNPSFYGRWVGFVEIMVPGFSAKGLDALLPTLDETETGWGWGLDSLWPKLLGYQGVGIIDGTPVLHARPVGQMRDAALARRVHAESDRILAANDCHQAHVTFGAFGDDLRRRDLPAEQLLLDLVRGWQYLIDEDPRILAWIMAYQGPNFSWPEYPIAGTPEHPRPVRAGDLAALA